MCVRRGHQMEQVSTGIYKYKLLSHAYSFQ
jgi:hypothetical protein